MAGEREERRLRSMSTPLQTPTTTNPLATDLRRRVVGEVHLPGDPGYDAARMPWNLAMDQMPAAVVVPVGRRRRRRRRRGRQGARPPRRTPGARPRRGRPRPARPHDPLRTAELGGVEVDPLTRTARVGAGVKLGARGRRRGRPRPRARLRLDRRGLRRGVLPRRGPGLALPGARPRLEPRHGDRARDAGGDHVRATATEHADLFWALRGGGGAFGSSPRSSSSCCPSRSSPPGRCSGPSNGAPRSCAPGATGPGESPSP
jgi:hypothetical protein